MNNEFNSRNLNRRLDLCGALERVAKREAIWKEQRQAPQQIAADSAAAYERGFRSAFAGGHRQIDLTKLREADPAAFAFLVRNRSLATA